MQSFTVHPLAPSRNYSQCRTMQPRSSSECQDIPMPSRYYTACTGCWWSKGSCTCWQWSRSKSVTP